MMNSARLEGLESRMLLSATVALLDGTLTITGAADAANTIILSVGTDDVTSEQSLVVDDGSGVAPEGTPVALADIRQVIMVGGALDDVLDASAVAVRAKIFGGLGNDSIKGSQVASQLMGGEGNDSILGSAGNDFLKGGAGDDQLDGADGNDRIWGGAGNDSIMGGAGNDRIWGNQGDDVIDGGDGADVMWGNQGKDMLYSDDDNSAGEDDGDRDRLFGDKRDGANALSYGPGDQAYRGNVKLKPVKIAKPSRR